MSSVCAKCFYFFFYLDLSYLVLCLFSRRRILPSCARSSQGYWDPERWHHDWKRSETPNDGSSVQPDSGHGKRRSAGDPRERLRKEQDGIVLSPQRRSFNSGCFVPVTQQPARSGRPDSPLGKSDLGHREISQTARRIGSGRIIARDVSWDYRPDKPEIEQEFTFSRSRERKESDERFERRSFGRDYDKDRHVSRNGRYYCASLVGNARSLTRLSLKLGTKGGGSATVRTMNRNGSAVDPLRNRTRSSCAGSRILPVVTRTGRRPRKMVVKSRVLRGRNAIVKGLLRKLITIVIPARRTVLKVLVLDPLLPNRIAQVLVLRRIHLSKRNIQVRLVKILNLLSLFSRG